jgi:hypothetical protein
MLSIDLAFPRSYEVAPIHELPQPAVHTHWFFPSRTTSGGKDGVTVQIVPQREAAWVGTFAFGPFGQNGVSGVYTTPHPDRVCVISRGKAYFAVTNRPEACEVLAFHPVLDVLTSTEHGLIIFSNHTELLAFDSSGMRWRTKRLSWDSLRIVEMKNGRILGEFWDIRSEQMSTFSVDIVSGKHEGGADFK